MVIDRFVCCTMIKRKFFQKWEDILAILACGGGGMFWDPEFCLPPSTRQVVMPRQIVNKGNGVNPGGAFTWGEKLYSSFVLNRIFDKTTTWSSGKFDGAVLGCDAHEKGPNLVIRRMIGKSSNVPIQPGMHWEGTKPTQQNWGRRRDMSTASTLRNDHNNEAEEVENDTARSNILPSESAVNTLKPVRRGAVGMAVGGTSIDPADLSYTTRASKLPLQPSLPSLRSQRPGEASVSAFHAVDASTSYAAGEAVDWPRFTKSKDQDSRPRSQQYSSSDAEPDDIFIPVKAHYISRSVDLKSLAKGPFLEVTFSRNNLIIRCEDRPPHSPVTADNPEMACLGFLKERYMVVFQYGSVVFFNFGDLEEVESLDIVRKYCSDEFREARKDDKTHLIYLSTGILCMYMDGTIIEVTSFMKYKPKGSKKGVEGPQNFRKMTSSLKDAMRNTGFHTKKYHILYYGVLVRPTLVEWSEGGHDRVMLRKLDIDNIRVISSILGQSIALDHYAKKENLGRGDISKWSSVVRWCLNAAKCFSNLSIDESVYMDTLAILLGVLDTANWKRRGICALFVGVDEMVTTFSELNRGMEQTGTFTMTRKSLFQLVAAANTTLADVILRLGLLERSDAAWKAANYAQIWEFLRDDFELDERFESLDFKLNIIQHNVRFFLEILQNRKSDTLEWIIILLITGEICVSLYDILHTAGAL